MLAVISGKKNSVCFDGIGTLSDASQISRTDQEDHSGRKNSYHGNDFMFSVSDFKEKNHEIWKLNQKKWLNNGKNVKIRMEYSI